LQEHQKGNNFQWLNFIFKYHFSEKKLSYFNPLIQDDEENSAEPALVIDETQEFELDRTKAELLCQGCRRNKALFMCAGCSRQWYCSKECQVR
jgi:MYND finger